MLRKYKGQSSLWIRLQLAGLFNRNPNSERKVVVRTEIPGGGGPGTEKGAPFEGQGADLGAARH